MRRHIHGFVVALLSIVLLFVVLPHPLTASPPYAKPPQEESILSVPHRQQPAPTRYHLVDLGPLWRGNSHANGINDAGQIVGSLHTDEGYHAFLWQNNAMQDLGTSGGEHSYATGINDAGQIVGYSETTGGKAHAFLWQNNVMQDLGTSGGEHNNATSINNAGQIVGSSFTLGEGSFLVNFLWQNNVMKNLGTLGGEDGTYVRDINDAGQIVGHTPIFYPAEGESYEHAFLWQNNVLQDLGTLGGVFSYATDINNAGQIVGHSTMADVSALHAFLWQNNVMQDLGTFGERETVANDINDEGQIVGYSHTAEGKARAFLWQDNVMQDLNDLIPQNSGWTLEVAMAINNNGWIVGAGQHNGTQGGFLLVAVPPLIFIPGVAGSTLVDRNNNKELWMGSLGGSDRSNLSLTAGLNVIATDALRTVFDGTVIEEPIYGPILEFLVQEGRYREYQVSGLPERRTTAGCDFAQATEAPNLFVFAYDWRLDNGSNAARLRDYIGCVQMFYPDTKVDILAHSMGSLVARRYILDNYDAVDKNLGHQVNQLITVGAPWLGAPKSIHILETGEFYPIIASGEDLRDAIATMPGPHQLVPSQGYEQVADQPVLVERGWDLDGNGINQEDYNYAKRLEQVDKRYSEFKPAHTSDLFHSYTRSWGGQDEWQTDDTGVAYTHIHGVKGEADTIGQVQAIEQIKCKFVKLIVRQKLVVKVCETTQIFRTVFTEGDGTVPMRSAIKQGNGLNLNAPNAQLVGYFGPNAGGDELVEHNGLLHNPLVQQKILNLLIRWQDNNPSSPELPELSAAAVEEFDVQPAYYMFLNGVQDVVIEDKQGNSTALIEGDVHGTVPGATTYSTGEGIEQIILSMDGTYTVTFESMEPLLSMELTVGTPPTITQALRYQDLARSVSTSFQLVLAPDQPQPLRYDQDRDGTFESVISPTVNVSGTLAQDTEPPLVTISTTTIVGQILVNVTAADTGSGVKAIYYSLNGQDFQLYTEPFALDVIAAQKVYAFADDLVANRSSLARYEQVAEGETTNRIFIPLIARP